MKKPFLPMNLQYFAEQTESESTTESETTETTEETKTEPELKYTDEDMDRIVTERVARETEKRNEAVEEAKKLAKMNADQKRDYELEKLKSENESLKSVQAHNQMKGEASKQFTEAGIENVPDGILELAARDSADDTSEAIETLTGWFNSAKEAATTELLKGKTPKVPGTHNTMTKDEIMKMRDPLARQQAIIENQNLFIK